MATVEQLLVRIEADTARLRSEMAKAERSTATATAKMNGELGKLDKHLDAVRSAAGRFGAALGAIGGASVLGSFAASIVKAGDAIAGMEARLTALIGSNDAAREALGELRRIGLQTGVALEESAAGFSRFTLAAKDIGATRAETLRLVETIQKLGAIAGASSADTSSAMIQLSQALASGKLQGDELRSILETMPTLARQIADGLGVSVGQLREMGTAGELTADKIFGALLRGADEVDRKFREMPVTAERGLGQLAVAWQGLLDSLDQKLQGSEFYKTFLRGGRALIGDLQGVIDPTLDQQFQAAMERFQKAAAERQRLATASPMQGGNPFFRGQADREYQTARAELERVQALIIKEAELRAEREQGEKAENEAAKAEAERNRAIAAREELLSKTLPLMKAAVEHDKKLSEAAARFGSGYITEAEYLAVFAQLEKDYAGAVEKATGSRKKADELAKAVREAIYAEAAAQDEARLAASRRAQEIIRGYDQQAEAIRRATDPVAVYNEKVRELTFAFETNRISAETFAAGLEDANQALSRATGAYIRDDLEAEIAANDRLLEALRQGTREYEQQAAAIQVLNAYKAAGVKITPEIEAQANSLAETLGRQRDEMQRLKAQYDEMDRAAADVTRTIATGFEEAITQGKNFGDVLRALAMDLSKIGTRMFVTKPLENFMTGGGSGGGGGIFQSLVSGIGGLFGGGLFPTGGGGMATTPGWGSFAGAYPVFHQGGVVGNDNVPTRMADPRLWLNAPRMHEGGMVPNLLPGEVPIIAEAGERVIPKDEVGSGPSVVINQHINIGQAGRGDIPYMAQSIGQQVQRGADMALRSARRLG